MSPTQFRIGESLWYGEKISKECYCIDFGRVLEYLHQQPFTRRAHSNQHLVMFTAKADYSKITQSNQQRERCSERTPEKTKLPESSPRQMEKNVLNSSSNKLRNTGEILTPGEVD